MHTQHHTQMLNYWNRVRHNIVENWMKDDTDTTLKSLNRQRVGVVEKEWRSWCKLDRRSSWLLWKKKKTNSNLINAKMSRCNTNINLSMFWKYRIENPVDLSIRPWKCCWLIFSWNRVIVVHLKSIHIHLS